MASKTYPCKVCRRAQYFLTLLAAEQGAFAPTKYHALLVTPVKS
jgi:hypothetical protein